MSTPARFGFALRSWLRSGEAYAAAPPPGTWTEGGCWLLAEALHRWARIGELWTLWGKSPRSRLSQLQHVVWRHGDLYFDGDGASREETLLLRAAVDWDIDDADLAPWGPNAEAQAMRHIACPAQAIDNLTVALRRRFGKPAEWGFAPAGRAGRAARRGRASEGLPRHGVTIPAMPALTSPWVRQLRRQASSAIWTQTTADWFGRQFGFQLHALDSGSWAQVFRVVPGVVLKVTTDPRDAAAFEQVRRSQRVPGRPWFPALPTVYGIWVFPRVLPGGRVSPGARVYGILVEEIVPTRWMGSISEEVLEGLLEALDGCVDLGLDERDSPFDRRRLRAQDCLAQLDAAVAVAAEHGLEDEALSVLEAWWGMVDAGVVVGDLSATDNVIEDTNGKWIIVDLGVSTAPRTKIPGIGAVPVVELVKRFGEPPGRQADPPAHRRQD